jgi:hypothetical protein
MMREKERKKKRRGKTRNDKEERERIGGNKMRRVMIK